MVKAILMLTKYPVLTVVEIIFFTFNSVFYSIFCSLYDSMFYYMFQYTFCSVFFSIPYSIFSSTIFDSIFYSGFFFSETFPFSGIPEDIPLFKEKRRIVQEIKPSQVEGILFLLFLLFRPQCPGEIARANYANCQHLQLTYKMCRPGTSGSPRRNCHHPCRTELERAASSELFIKQSNQSIFYLICWNLNKILHGICKDSQR